MDGRIAALFYAPVPSRAGFSWWEAWSPAHLRSLWSLTGLIMRYSTLLVLRVISVLSRPIGLQELLN